MLDQYLERDDVRKIIKQIESNPKYSRMNIEAHNYGRYMKEEFALYLFYDFLLKYKIIVDDKDIQNARVYLTYATGKVLKQGANLLGIEMPDKM